MTVPAVHCEARKIAYRQTKDGLVVSFVVHPNDMPDALAVAPLGQRYMLALAAIGDDEKPVSPTVALSTQEESTKQPVAVGEPTPAQKRYASLPHMKQAAARAAMLCTDKRFQRWISGTGAECGEERAAVLLRRELGLQSRAEIGEDKRAYREFLDLEFAYQSETGLAASDPYADVAR